MLRAVCLGVVFWFSVAAAAPRVPDEAEVAALRQAYREDGTIASLLDWADGERARGKCLRADKLYRQAFYRDEITPEERYRAQIGYERCEDPDHPRRPSEQLRVREAPPKRAVKRPRPAPRPAIVPLEADEESESDPHLAWKIAGFTTAGLTVATAAVKMSGDNPEGRDFVLNSTTGVIAVGAAMTAAFLWRGYSGISMAPAVTASSVGGSARVEF
jgi:hypothetical protein